MMGRTTMGIRRRELEKRIAGSARRFARDCSATTAIEYALLTFIAVAIIVVVSQLGGSLNALYSSVQNAMSSF
jgi:Flp pilus assembly pilin Flp